MHRILNIRVRSQRVLHGMIDQLAGAAAPGGSLLLIINDRGPLPKQIVCQTPENSNRNIATDRTPIL
jgi:hypothetical protein